MSTAEEAYIELRDTIRAEVPDLTSDDLIDVIRVLIVHADTQGGDNNE